MLVGIIKTGGCRTMLSIRITSIAPSSTSLNGEILEVLPLSKNFAMDQLNNSRLLRKQKGSVSLWKVPITLAVYLFETSDEIRGFPQLFFNLVANWFIIWLRRGACVFVVGVVFRFGIVWIFGVWRIVFGCELD